MSPLIEIAWKSIAIGAVIVTALRVLDMKPPSERVALTRLGVIILLIAPFAIHLVPVGLTTAVALGGPLEQPLASMEAPLHAGAFEHSATVVDEESINTSLVLIAGYATGVLLLLARLLAGIHTLRVWTRAGRPVDAPAWRAASEKLGFDRVMILATDRVSSPLSWGWRRPVVLIDPESHGSADMAEAVLAHELAHIRSWDWAFLILARIAIAILWFNPFAWTLGRALVTAQEVAADRFAVDHVAPVRYAQTLVDLSRRASCALPGNPVGGSPLEIARRVPALLGDPPSPSNPLTRVATVALLPALSLGVVGIRLSDQANLVAPRSAPMQSRPPHVDPMPRSPGPVPGTAVAKVTQVQGVTEPRATSTPAHPVRAAAAPPLLDEDETARVIRDGIRSGAPGLAAGADRLQLAADQILDEGTLLRSDAAFRDRKILEAARRGQILDHASLIRSGDDMTRTARQMLTGVKEMRDSAAQMANGQ